MRRNRTPDLIGNAFDAIVTRPSTGQKYEAGCWPGCGPSIEIAWDQWARTRIKCDHGTFEAVSDFLNLQESFDRCVVQFNAFDHVTRCYKETPVPEEWKDGKYWNDGDTTECDLWDNHDGPCKIYATDEEEKEAGSDRRIIMCVPCRRELHFIENPRSWVHKHDNSERCYSEVKEKETNKWKPVPY